MRHRRQQQAIIHHNNSNPASNGERASLGSPADGSSAFESSVSHDPADGLQYRRVPDNEDHYMPATTIYTSHDHTIEIHNHRKARFLYDERWASNATYEDYKRKTYGGGSFETRPPARAVLASSGAKRMLAGPSKITKNETATPSGQHALTSTVGIQAQLSRAFRQAGTALTYCALLEKHHALGEEVAHLCAVLHRVEGQSKDPESILNGSHDSQKEQLKHTVEECGTILSVLNSLLENNSELSEDEVVARLSGKIKYRGKQIQNLSDLRAAISTKTMFVTLYLDQGFAGSRIERQNITSSGECALPGKSSQITYNPLISTKECVEDDPPTSDTKLSEGMDKEMSSSASDYQTSESEHRGDGNTSDELCCRLENVHVDEEQIMSPILDPARQAMVERVMEEFWVIFNQRGPSNGPQQESRSSTIVNQNQYATHSRALQRKRKRQGKEDDYEDSDSGSDERHQPPGKSTPLANGLNTSRPRFACPFRKHDPHRYSIYSHRACALSHWPSIARVKEHLYRSHEIALHCERCWRIFDKAEDLKSHRTVDATQICQVEPGNPPDGITPEIERKLRSRQKKHPGQTGDDRWRDIYRLLFPNEDVPSPYYEAPQDGGPLSPDSRDLADYEAYAHRELPRLVRASVLEIFRREMQPIEASLVANLVNTIQECQARMFRSYSERFGEEQPSDTPSDLMANGFTSLLASNLQESANSGQNTSDGGNSMHTPLNILHATLQPSQHMQNADMQCRTPMQTPSSNFLNAAFQQPPPVQATGFEPDFRGQGILESLQAPATIDTFVSSSVGTIFSAHGYGSEYTSTTMSSRGPDLDTACPPGQPEVQNDTFGWQDWNNESLFEDFF